jgi:hypothetical protein
MSGQIVNHNCYVTVAAPFQPAIHSRTEQHGTTEIGIIAHEGREFSALGSVVTDTHVTAYLAKDNTLTKWNGEVIGTYRITRTWSTPRSFASSTMNQVYATVNGRTYTGRSAGVGMIFRGRLSERAAIATTGRAAHTVNLVVR